MPSPSPRLLAAVCAVALLLPACGDEDEPDAAGATGGTSATAAGAASPALGEAALRTVRNRLVDCVRQADLGVVVRFRDGEAAPEEPGRRRPFESSLAAPRETAGAIDDGALYVGLRDDERADGLTPDRDVLIFATEQAAVRATTPLRTEAGDPVAATPSGRFVTVILPQADADGDDPEGAEAKLADCQERAEAA